MPKITAPIIISIITIAIAIVSWNFLFNSLYGVEEGWFGIWIKPMVGFLILGVMLSLACLLIESKKVLIFLLGVVAFSFLLVFSSNKYILLSLFLLLTLLVLGARRIKDEAKIRFKIRIGKILEKGLPLILTGFIVVISVTYCFTPSAQKFEIKIPQKFLAPFEELLIKQFIAPGLPQGINLLKNQKVSEAVSEIINTKIEEFSQPYKKYIPLALAISLFLFLRLVAIPISWLIVLLSWIVFKLLVAFGVTRIEKVQREAEVIQV